MQEQMWDRGLGLTALAVALVSGVSVWLAWQTSGDLASRLSIGALAPIMGAAIMSYSLRVVRFHFFLLRSGVPISFRSTIVVQTIGFALSVTPGHVGEVFKLHLIRQRVGTPVAQTAPLFVLDRLTEGGGFLILAIGSAFALPALRDQTPVPSLMLLALAVAFAFALTRRRWSGSIAAVNARLANSKLGGRFVPHLQNLWNGLESSFTPSIILGGLCLSAIARFADGLVIFFAAHIVGVVLDVPTAVFILAVGGLAGGISLLPAGIGAVELTTTGLLVLHGATGANALTIALLARLFSLWLWVALGLGAAFLLRLPAFRAWFGVSAEP